MATTKTYDWGDSKINDYYNRNINTMQPQTVDAPVQELPVQTKESIQDQIRGYLNPAYEKAIKSLAKQRDYERRYILESPISDPNSRSASSDRSQKASESDWYRHASRNLDVGETYARSAVSNNYLANIAKGTADQYDRYLSRKAEYDTLNANARMDADLFNAKVRDALEEMIYERSVRRARGGF